MSIYTVSDIFRPFMVYMYFWVCFNVNLKATAVPKPWWLINIEWINCTVQHAIISLIHLKWAGQGFLSWQGTWEEALPDTHTKKWSSATSMISRILAGGFDADTSPFYEHWKQFHPKINSMSDASGWGKKYQIFMVILQMPCFPPSAGLLLGYSAVQKSHLLMRLQQLRCFFFCFF